MLKTMLTTQLKITVVNVYKNVTSVNQTHFEMLPIIHVRANPTILTIKIFEN